jgi:hypothetical protein
MAASQAPTPGFDYLASTGSLGRAADSRHPACAFKKYKQSMSAKTRRGFMFGSHAMPATAGLIRRGRKLLRLAGGYLANPARRTAFHAIYRDARLKSVSMSIQFGNIRRV